MSKSSILQISFTKAKFELPIKFLGGYEVVEIHMV